MRPDYVNRLIKWTTVQRHIVKKGKLNFRPQSIWSRLKYWLPFRWNRRDDIVLRMFTSESLWWSLEDWEGDRDYLDWMKGPGITAGLSSNQRNSIMLGFRPSSSQQGHVEVCIYGHDPTGDRVVLDGSFVRESFPPGTEFSLRLNLVQDIIRLESFSYRYPGMEQHQVRTFPDPTRQLTVVRPWYGSIWREVGGWAGGDDNSPGPYGGAAHQAMSYIGGVQMEVQSSYIDDRSGLIPNMSLAL